MEKKNIVLIFYPPFPLPAAEQFGWGVRHLQVGAMCLAILALFTARSTIGVAILAMTDHTRVRGPEVSKVESLNSRV